VLQVEAAVQALPTAAGESQEEEVSLCHQAGLDLLATLDADDRIAGLPERRYLEGRAGAAGNSRSTQSGPTSSRR
jgi:hypothetical protein